jgi:hypothetical protein
LKFLAEAIGNRPWILVVSVINPASANSVDLGNKQALNIIRDEKKGSNAMG